MLSAFAAFTFAYATGRFIREYQELQASKARLKEIQATMDMTKPGSYLEWLSN